MTHDPDRTDAIPVHIVMILDESGSMSALRDDLIGGVNMFLDEQRSKPGKCRLTLVKFAPYTVLHNAVDIHKVPSFTAADYHPFSMTPLLDAEGTAITAAVAREAFRSAKNKRQEATLVVSFTDGQENTSREWTRGALSALKAEREAAGWAFMYLGVGHDAYGQSSTIGTRSANTTSEVRSSAGLTRGFAAVSNVASNYRTVAGVGDRQVLTSANRDLYSTLGVAKPVGDTADAGTARKRSVR